MWASVYESLIMKESFLQVFVGLGMAGLIIRSEILLAGLAGWKNSTKLDLLKISQVSEEQTSQLKNLKIWTNKIKFTTASFHSLLQKRSKSTFFLKTLNLPVIPSTIIIISLFCVPWLQEAKEIKKVSI